MFQEAAKDRERLKEVEAECRLLKARLNRWNKILIAEQDKLIPGLSKEEDRGLEVKQLSWSSERMVRM